MFNTAKIKSLRPLSEFCHGLPFEIGQCDVSASRGEVCDHRFLFSAIEFEGKTSNCDNLVKVKSEDNDKIEINKLAVRIDVGVHSALNWILEQFSIDRSDLKSDDDSDLTDIISKYCDSHQDNRLLQYLLHTLKDELIRKYMVCCA